MSDEASPTPQPKQNAVARFGRDVFRSAVVDVVGKALSWASLVLLAAFALLMWQGGSLTIPAWVIALVLLVLVIGVVLGRRQNSGLRNAIEGHGRRIEELEPLEEELEESESWARTMQHAVERYEVYTNHLAEVLDHLQRVVAGDIEVSIPTYIERGILDPARDILAEVPAEHVRLSVLLPDDDDECFEMYFAAGHSITGKSKYRVPIKDTLSRIAYETGEVQMWDDVTEDDRFDQNPEASWPTRTMVSIPLWYGDAIVGVFNAISSQPSAFDPAEHRYLASLAPIISVAVGVDLKNADE